VLFTDVRGFSRLAEKLNPQDTCAMMSDVMERLTQCIRRFEGVVVDYAGDGIFAMWNAPMDQPDHAARACRAALAMLACQPQLNTDWHDKIGMTLQLGIGLNTGQAMCGNTGSKVKFKYGPLGHTVNLGSRVEGATKQLGVPLLVSGTTRTQLPEAFALRRLCRARVVNVQGPVDFYELAGENLPPEVSDRFRVYERALQQYEASQFGEACQTLYPLLAQQEGKYDIPSLNLLTRAVEALKNPPSSFDGIYEFSSK
jgi:adenylate cyclase